MEEEKNYHQLTDNLRISSDGQRNIILERKYEKSLGKGKYAEKSGEFGYNSPTYYSSIASLANALRKEAELEAVNAVEKLQLDEITAYIDEFEKRIHTYLNENITLELAKLKGAKEDDE